MSTNQLLPLGLNPQFVEELVRTQEPCFAMGLVRENARSRGFLALRLGQEIPSTATASGFRFGHQLMGRDDFEVVRFSFEFNGCKTFHALVNPANTIVQRVLGTMLVSCDYLFLLLQPSGSVTVFRTDIGEDDLAGLQTNWPRIQQSTTSDAQYCQSLTAFKREFGTEPTLKWICHGDDSYLDLDGELVSLNPA